MCVRKSIFGCISFSFLLFLAFRFFCCFLLSSKRGFSSEWHMRLSAACRRRGCCHHSTRYTHTYMCTLMDVLHFSISAFQRTLWHILWLFTLRAQLSLLLAAIAGCRWCHCHTASAVHMYICKFSDCFLKLPRQGSSLLFFLPPCLI